jgi:hypothetical protein
MARGCPSALRLRGGFSLSPMQVRRISIARRVPWGFWPARVRRLRLAHAAESSYQVLNLPDRVNHLFWAPDSSGFLFSSRTRKFPQISQYVNTSITY